MNMSLETHDGTAILRINGPMTIYEAAQFRGALMDGLAEAEVLTLDLETMEKIDIAGIQLIVAARKTARQEGKRMTLTGAPPVFIEVLAQAGLDPEKFLHPEREV